MEEGRWEVGGVEEVQRSSGRRVDDVAPLERLMVGFW